MKKILVFVFLLLSIAPSVVKAQNPAQEISCSDYFIGENINVDVSTDSVSYNSGDPVFIKGTIENKNAFPLLDLVVQAKVIKYIDETQYIVVDEFDVLSDFTLLAQNQKEISYNYVLPLNYHSGEYKIAFFVIEKDAFDISGVSITEDTPSAFVDFSVTGDGEGYVYVDSSLIKVNGADYSFEDSFLGNIKEGTIIQIPVINLSSFEKEVKITYALYKNDFISERNKIDSKSEKIDMSSGSTVDLNYNFTYPDVGSYILSITSEVINNDLDKSVFNEKTITNIRLSSATNSSPRINFIGATNFPFKGGEDPSFITCLDIAGFSDSAYEGSVEHTLYDKKGNELAKNTYKGLLKSGDFGLLYSFGLKGKLSDFSLVSKVFDSKGTLVEEIRKEYTCEQIDPAQCAQSGTLKSYLLVLGSLLIVLLIVLVIKKKNNIESI